MRHVLATRMTLRRVPEVAFHYDEGLAAHQRVEEILHEIHEADAARGAMSETAAAGEATPTAPGMADATAPATPSPAPPDDAEPTH